MSFELRRRGRRNIWDVSFAGLELGTVRKDSDRFFAYPPASPFWPQKLVKARTSSSHHEGLVEAARALLSHHDDGVRKTVPRPEEA